MSTLLTSPGVYIEEVPSGVRTLTGVATSITAFVGRALRGPVNEATEISSFGEFTRTFGNLWRDSALSYAVSHFFQNGGREALIVRVTNGAATADLSLTGGEAGSTLDLAAASPGAWGNALRVSVEIGANTANANDQRLFNLLVREVDPSDESVTVQRETFRNVTTDQNAARFVRKVLESESTLVRVKDGDIKALTMAVANDAAFKNGIDGNPLTAAQVNGDENNRSGIYALLLADLFNLLVIPPYKSDRTVDASTWTAAAKLCQDRRAVLLIDPDISWTTPKTVLDNVMGTAGLRSGLSAYAKNAAVYFPWVRIADPLSENRLELFPPSGVMAGAIARTDAARGVWKAPAGTEAGLTGVRELGAKLTDADSGDLNQKGINALRAFPVIGNVCWGGAHAGRRGPAHLRVEIPAGATDGAVPRGESVPRLAVGRVRAQRRAAVGANSAERRRVHAEPVPQGRLSGHLPARGLLRQVRQRDDNAKRYRPGNREHPGRFRTAQACGVRDRQDSADGRAGRDVNAPAQAAAAQAPGRRRRRDARGGGRAKRRKQVRSRTMAEFSVNSQRFDPYKNFKFRVKWDGRYVAGVSKVSALSRKTNAIEHRVGGDPSTVRKSPGQTTYEPITLERGVTHDVEFEQWANKVWNYGAGLGAEVSLKDFRKDLIIEVYNEAGQPVLSYKVYRCWPSSYRALPELDASANAIAIQTLELQNEGWERDYEVVEPTEPSFTEPG